MIGPSIIRFTYTLVDAQKHAVLTKPYQIYYVYVLLKLTLIFLTNYVPSCGLLI